MREYQFITRMLVINYILSLMSVTLTKPVFMKSIYKEKEKVLLNTFVISPSLSP